MPLNPFFNQRTFVSEQNLISDLTEEAIQIHGVSIFYLPREVVNLDTLFGEDPLAHYADKREIEVYIKNFQSFEGQQDFISKFGLQIEDQITFLVSQRRFYQVFPEMARPRENDIIYLELAAPNRTSSAPSRYLFQINFVNPTEKFFQLGKLYTFEMKCEAMNYSHEKVQTGNPEVDAVAQRHAYAVEVSMSSGSGSFEYEEFVYQGHSLVDASATGTVVSWDDGSKLLTVNFITGEFVQGQTVHGVTSNAEYLVGAPVDVLPTVKDPISDNDLIAVESPEIILNRGNNPRFHS